MHPVILSLLFFLANITVVLIVWALNMRRLPRRAPDALPEVRAAKRFDPQALIQWEFEYARSTASEAMAVRQTMLNFYLIVTGIIGTGVLAMVGVGSPREAAIAAALLWLLCVLGWFYFFKLVRLRQAWHQSTAYMNHLKAFYIAHVQDMPSDELREAFLWQRHTLPLPERSFTVFHFTAALVAFLDSVAYVAGGLLLGYNRMCRQLVFGADVCQWVPVVLGVALFVFHLFMYWTFLHEQ